MRDFFTYLPLAEEPLVWGAAVTSAGFMRTPAGSDYPAASAHHPPDHMFTWDKGRVLESWQILLIQEGAGYFESQPTGRQRLHPGSVFIVFPGVWHRYAPDRAGGWTESWIELHGPVLERLRELKSLEPEHAVFHPGAQPELSEAMDRCHQLAQSLRPGARGQLSTVALEVLALVLTLREPASGAPDYMEDIVRRGRNLLVEKCDQPLQIREVARELGVSESHFRRAFKAYSSVSPKQYLMEMRLRRVRALLQNSVLTVTQIAEQMGYHSAYHLSAEFKKHSGLAPSAWRRR